MVVRITVPLRSHGVETVSWATCTDGRPATTDDNRRPVDYPVRIQSLESGGEPVKDIEGWQSGRLKQKVIHHTLQLRTRESDLFSRGEYLPLDVEGPQSEHVIAFARRLQDRTVIILVTRLASRLLAGEGNPLVPAACWHDTAALFPGVANATWQDIFTRKAVRLADGRIAIAEALSMLPVSVLIVA